MSKDESVASKMRRALVYYMAGAPEYEHLMDDLSCECTDGQWEKLCRTIDEADDFMGESEIGTLWQKENLAAKQEKRRSRNPLIFDDEATWKRKMAELAREYRAKGIPFREDDELQREQLQMNYDKALAAAPTESRKMGCLTCKKERMCKARPSGLISSPIMWVCRECWAYALEMR